MKCPKCQSRGRCVDSREYGNYRQRRYKCTCGETYHTHEKVIAKGSYAGMKGQKRGLTITDTVMRGEYSQLLAQAKADLRAELEAFLRPHPQHGTSHGSK